MKVTLDLPDELYRALKVEAARSDRNVRDLATAAIEEWLDREEEAEDRASAQAALEEYRQSGGESAAAFFEHLAAEARARYDSEG